TPGWLPSRRGECRPWWSRRRTPRTQPDRRTATEEPRLVTPGPERLRTRRGLAAPAAWRRAAEARTAYRPRVQEWPTRRSTWSARRSFETCQLREGHERTRTPVLQSYSESDAVEGIRRSVS